MDRGDKTITTPLVEIVTKRVCHECNTGWLARIESQARPVFTALLDGSAVRISETDRWIIARWFNKTILTFF
jgi:hypothetical protein